MERHNPPLALGCRRPERNFGQRATFSVTTIFKVGQESSPKAAPQSHHGGVGTWGGAAPLIPITSAISGRARHVVARTHHPRAKPGRGGNPSRVPDLASRAAAAPCPVRADYSLAPTRNPPTRD